MIKDTVTSTWRDIEFLTNVLLVLTVPAEYTEGTKAIMRECVHKAGLIDDINSIKLQFITEGKLQLANMSFLDKSQANM